ncbi:hypothetical protein TWF706_006766 [Orbilia oligospora]|nr:hypothetical protein TWF706_006766 [Orbilia oligospora]
MDKEENRQIISWLTGTDYESIHADYGKKKDEWNGRIAKTEVETKDSKGLTALSLATQRGYKATVQLLLDAGAEIETDRNATIQSSGFQIWGVLVPPEGIVSESHPGETSVAGTVALAATAEATGERNHSKRSGIYLWAAHSGHVKLLYKCKQPHTRESEIQTLKWLRACPEHDVKLFSTLWRIVRDRDPKLKFLAS